MIVSWRRGRRTAPATCRCAGRCGRARPARWLVAGSVEDRLVGGDRLVSSLTSPRRADRPATGSGSGRRRRRELELLGVDVEQLGVLALAEVEPLERVERLLVGVVDLEDLPIELDRAIELAELLLETRPSPDHRQRVEAVSNLGSDAP